MCICVYHFIHTLHEALYVFISRPCYGGVVCRFAFVEFTEPEGATAATRLSGKTLSERPVKVSDATRLCSARAAPPLLRVKVKFICQIPRMLSPKTLTSDAFDREFDFELARLELLSCELVLNTRLPA